MKSIIRIAIYVILFIGAGFYFYYSYFVMENKEVKTQKVEVSETVISVGIDNVRQGDISTEVVLTGNIKANAKVTVFSKIPGRLEKLSVDVGDNVTKGEDESERIALIEHDTLQAQVNQAKAGLEVAEAALKQIEVKLVILGRDKTRLTNLYNEKSIPKKKLEDIETAYNAALAGKSAAEARIAQAKAGIQLAEIMLKEASIYPTLSGTVSGRYVEEGAMISPGVKIVDIIDIDKVKVTASLPEIYLTRVGTGSDVSLKVDAYSDKVFKGTVRVIHPELNELDRTASVEIVMDNPGHLLKPGMFARVTIILEQKHDTLKVPQKAVVHNATGKVVFVVDNDLVAHAVSVRTGLSSAKDIEIIEGLTKGDRVIVNGNIGLRDGTQVRIVE